MPVRRFDSATISKAVRLDNGWLRAPAFLTRTGIFEYRQADNSVRRELRPAEEVFAPEALASFEAVPVVVRHPIGKTPDGLLDAKSARDLQVGAVGAPRRDGDFVAATILLTDADAVAVVEGGMTEVSCGYRCDTDETPGVWQGKPYDAVQRNIRGNHLAIEDRARGGPELRIRLDSGDAEQVVSHIEQTAKPSNLPEPRPMKKIRIDGVEYEVSEQVAQAFEKLEADRKARFDSEKTALDAAKAEKSKADARADTAEAKVKDLQTNLDAAIDPKAIAAKVSARVELETKARGLLGDEAKLDGMDDDAIKRAVLAKVSPDVKIDGKDAIYVSAAFDFATAGGIQATRAPATAPYDGADVNKARTDGAPVDSTKARQTYNDHVSNAWKRPEPKA